VNQANSSNAQRQFYSLLCQLEKINDRLLNAFKKHENNSVIDLIDERTSLSEQMQNLSQTHNQELNDETKAKSMQVLSQDKELMIYLELELQKVKGKYSRATMISGLRN
jgi:hypothetical protein